MRSCRPARAGAWRLGGVLLTCAVLLAACAPPWAVDPEAENRFDAYRTEWESITAWNVSGRAALQGGGESVTLSVRWREEEDGSYRLELSGPFGAGAARLIGDAEGVVLDDGRGEPMVADTPETLVELYTGHDVPVTALRAWLLALPAPGLTLEARTLDRHGRPNRYEQDGWVVNYRGWTEVDGLPLPARVDIRKADQQLRVALSGWSIEHPDSETAPDP